VTRLFVCALVPVLIIRLPSEHFLFCVLVGNKKPAKCGKYQNSSMSCMHQTNFLFKIQSIVDSLLVLNVVAYSTVGCLLTSIISVTRIHLSSVKNILVTEILLI
jgi:hypothetical protein